MSELLSALSGGVKTYDLGREYRVGMPQSPNHPAYWHALPRRHGDMTRADGGSAANDMITLGTHVGTHIDALAHVSHDGMLHGGVPVQDACVGGRFETYGAHTIPPIVARGVLLDIPGALGVEGPLEGGFEITPEHLDAAVEKQEVDLAGVSAILVRSGWGSRFDVSRPDLYTGKDSGVPGVSEAGAKWLADKAPIAAGADTIAFEKLAPGAGHALLPAHRVLLVEAGIYIIEAMNLEELAADGVHEFLFVLSPLNLYGATGSPVRPLAVVARS